MSDIEIKNQSIIGANKNNIKDSNSYKSIFFPYSR